MRHTDPWWSNSNWFDPSHVESLQRLLPGFSGRWHDKRWRSVIRASVHWYTRANQHSGGTDGALILASAALELIAFASLVEGAKSLSPNGFAKLPHADHLRLLFSHFRIPLELPDSLTNLGRTAAELNWNDGPQALAEIRNALVHPTGKVRQKLRASEGMALIGEAHRLAMWYLELSLLALFQFDGYYSSRLITGGEVEPVPWSSRSS